MTDVTHFPGFDPTQKPEHTLRVEREFDAPREALYQAFVDPDQLAAWFGPVGFHVPRDSVPVDVRVGGHRRMTMGPDGADESSFGPMETVFTEVIANELLVGEEAVEGIPGAEQVTLLRLRLEFHELPGGRSRLVVEQGPHTQFMIGMAEQGWGSSFTKLDALLAAA
jgi:uncharacterized protein YndB with AHSA1/START domain